MSASSIDSNIITEYFNKNVLLKEFCSKIETLINELLKENSIVVHQVPVRVKTLDSLARKLERKEGKYTCLDDLTDVVGVRIIVYLENEVDLVSNIITREFFVDSGNSVDKRKLNVDSFGYKSLHYVVGLNKERCALTENKKFANLKAEIQIRSILQHAWAEIEHDIGYKGENAVPEQYKRTFHRVAALLETADLEFVRLKNELLAYENEVYKSIEKTPNLVKIDKASVSSYLTSSTVVSTSDKEIVNSINAEISFDNTSVIDFILNKHGFFKIETIKDLNDKFEEYKKETVGFAKFYISDTDIRIFPFGISIFYLFYILALKSNNIEFVTEYLDYGEEKVGDEDFSSALIQKYNEYNMKS